MFSIPKNNISLDPWKAGSPRQEQFSVLKILRIFYCNDGDDLMLVRAYMQVFYPVVPFDYNGREFLPPTKKQYWAWVALGMFMIFQSARFVILVQELTHQKRLDETCVMVFWCISYISTVVHLYNGVANWNHFTKTLNSWIQYKRESTTPFAFLIRKLIPLGTTSWLINLAFAIFTPTASHFLFSITNIEPHGTYHWITLPFFLFYESLSSYIVFGSHMIHDAFLMGWVATISTKILKLGSISKSEGNAITNIELLQYRTIQVFEKLTNQAFGIVFLFIKFSSYFKISYIAVMIISGFTHIKIINIIYGIPLLLPLILRIHGYLPQMAVMRRQSIQLLRKWRFEKSRQLEKNRKLIRSCRIIEYNAGGAYEIKESTILKFCEGVAGQTVANLIALKSGGF